jgi:hypothetical protein
LGLLGRVPEANRFVASDADSPNAADHVYGAITVARQSFLEPDTVVLNPADWADRLDDELADDEAVTEAFGEGVVAYRFSDALVGQFRRTAAENAKGAGLN